MGLEGDILFLEIVSFCLGGAAKLRWAEGPAAPRWAWQRAQNDGCAQRTGAHARLKPTSHYIKAYCRQPRVGRALQKNTHTADDHAKKLPEASVSLK